MHAFIVAAALSSIATQAEAEAPSPPPQVPECFGVESAAAPVERRTAPPGGRWWVPITWGGTGSLALLDADGAVVPAPDAALTAAAAAIAVPSDAAPGARFHLSFATQDLGELVVGDVLAPAPFTLTIDPSGAVAGSCTCDDGFSEAPRALTVQVAWTGGPAVLDLWAVPADAQIDDLSPRVVDSVLLPDQAAGVMELTASDAFSGTVALVVTARARDLDTLAEVGAASTSIGDIPALPEGTRPNAPACEDFGGGRNTGGPLGPLGCAASPAEPGALAAALLIVGAVLRRRRQGSMTSASSSAQFASAPSRVVGS